MSEELAKQKSSPKDVFMHLMMIAMLYVGTWHFISLWFDYINFLFPDPQSYYYVGMNESVLVSIATIIVVFPVYFLLSWLLEKEMNVEPAKRELRVRKWLVYLTLFLAAIAIITDFVMTLFNFLNGESTARFLLKASVVLVTAAVVFGYYIWDARRTGSDGSKLPKKLALAVGAVLIGSVVYGFFLFGTPGHQRDLRTDATRVNDLQNIQMTILDYWQKKGILPIALPDLTDNISGFVVPIDPETGNSYEFVASGATDFKLCAIFRTKSLNSPSSSLSYSINWVHNAGHVCFDRNINPSLYELNKPMPVIIQTPTAKP